MLLTLGDMLQYESNLVLFKASYDVYLFVLAPDRENELMMQSFLSSLYDSLDVIHAKPSRPAHDPR